MAFCTHCGAPLPDGARFCTSCGTPTAAPNAPQASGPAPVRPVQPQPVQPQPVQPRPTQPVQPVRATPTPQGGIVIDAPEGATVTISDGPQEHSVTAPAEKGEFGAIQWDEPAPQQQPRTPQAPQYQQPYPKQASQYRQPAQQPQGPLTMQQALNQEKGKLFGPFGSKKPATLQGAAPAAEPPKKKKSVLWWVLAILVGLVIFAMKMGW